MSQRSYTGDDQCPKCNAVYCSDWPDWRTNTSPGNTPDAEDVVVCIGCGHSDRLLAFMDKFMQTHTR